MNDVVLLLPLLLVALVTGLAGLMMERTHPRTQPILLQREPHGPRSIATVRYAIDVGESA